MRIDKRQLKISAVVVVAAFFFTQDLRSAGIVGALSFVASLLIKS